MRRCRETALPLSRLWNREATVLPSVAEIPSPPLDAEARRAWLTAAMVGTWTELHARAPAGSSDYLAWRRSVVEALLAVPQDCVIFTHYIAINVAASAAQKREEVVCFRPDHASVTIVEAGPRGLELVQLGRQAQTGVLTR
jgi:broad specificity phosphatase PhoE